jgi:cytidyltransferase-like protein
MSDNPPLPIARTVEALRETVRGWRRKGLSVSFVPTMGALHEGHLTLVREAGQRADRVVASVFVNPTQFAAHEDLGTYPRREAQDAELLAAAGCHLLFAPTVEEMYPDGTIGTVSMVLATAISSSAVKVSGDDLLVEQDVGEDDHDQRLGLQQPADEEASPAAQPSMRPARCTPISLPATEATSSSAGAPNTAARRRPPVGAQAGRQEEHRHHHQQHVVAQLVHLLLVEPVARPAPRRPGRRRPCSAGRPSRRQAAGRQPDQADVPAVAPRQATHQLAHGPGRQREADQEHPLPPDPLPVQQDQRQHAPDRDVVQAGIAQDALAQRLAQDASFSISRTRIGSAVTAQAMPMPSTNCQVCPRPHPAGTGAAPARPRSRTAAARPAPAPPSRRSRPVLPGLRRSSSMPAIQTNSITAHQATPFSGLDHLGRNTKA